MMAALLLLLLLGPAEPDVGEYVVVTSTHSRFEQMSAWQLRQVYLGKLDRLAGMHLVAVQLSRGATRKSFDRFLFRDPADLENYWLTHKLLGDANPPMSVGSWALVISFIKRNPGFVGYLPKERASQEDLERHGLKRVLITK